MCIGGNPNADFPLTTSVTFNGNATFNQNTTGSMDSEVDLYANTTVTFNGTLSGGTGGVCIDFGTYNNAPNSIVIINGNFGTGLQRFDVEDNVSVIFDGSSPTSQLASIAANIVDIGTSSSGYLGLGENYIGSVAAFPPESEKQENSVGHYADVPFVAEGVGGFGPDIYCGRGQRRNAPGALMLVVRLSGVLPAWER